jgi:hypothetical protein
VRTDSTIGVAKFEMAVAKPVQWITGRNIGLDWSTFANLRNFAWPQGYGALSVGIFQVQERVHYIEQQLEHRLTMDLKKSIYPSLKNTRTFEEKYLWDYLRAIGPYPTGRSS